MKLLFFLIFVCLSLTFCFLKNFTSPQPRKKLFFAQTNLVKEIVESYMVLIETSSSPLLSRYVSLELESEKSTWILQEFLNILNLQTSLCNVYVTEVVFRGMQLRIANEQNMLLSKKERQKHSIFYPYRSLHFFIFYSRGYDDVIIFP